MGLTVADAGDHAQTSKHWGYTPALGHMNRPPHRECTLKRLGHAMDDDGLGQVSLSRRQLLSVLGAGAFGGWTVLGAAGPASAAVAHRLPPRSDIVDRYSGVTPRYWGMYPPGSWSTFRTTTTFTANSVCLTFDACGSTNGSGYDSRLISVLRERRVPATLFINRRWARNNPEIFRRLAGDPLFEIGNHGTAHKPLSVSGRSAYGIRGTSSVGGVYDEIAGMHTWLAKYYDRRPQCFRPGTAHADEVATRICRDMHERVVSFSVNGDFGATASAATVYQQFLKLRPGGIALAHFNHPGSGTARGLARALPVLKSRGYRFRKVSQVIP